MKKKVLFSLVFMFIIIVFAYSQASSTLGISSNVASNISLVINSPEYVMDPAGKTSQTLVTTMLVKSNSKRGYSLTISSLNINDGTFNAVSAENLLEGAVYRWPYKLYLQKGSENIVEFTENALWKQDFNKKTQAGGDLFSLYITYNSSETLNLDAGTYTDTVTITLASK